MSKSIFPITLKDVLFLMFGIIILFLYFFPSSHYVFDHLADRFLSEEQLTQKYQNRVLENAAKRKNIPLEEYKRIVEASEKKKSFNQKIHNAIIKRDLESLDSLLTLAEKNEHEVNYDIYQKAIKNNSVGALKVIHKHGYKCEHISDEERKTNSDSSRIERLGFHAFFASNNPKINAEWISLGCYKKREHVVNHIISRKKEALAFLDITQEHSDFWHEVIRKSIQEKKEDLAAKYVSRVLANTKSTGEYALTFPPELKQKRDVLEEAIHKGMPTLIKAILESDKDFVIKAESTSSVMKLLSKRPLELPIDSFLEDILDLDLITNDLPTYWDDALAKGDAGMLKILLDHDERLNLTSYTSENLDLQLRGNDVKYFPYFISRGLDYKQFEYRGLDQLSQAISKSNIHLVRAILEAGIDPSISHRGKSILTTPMIGDFAQQQQIKELLTKYSATQDANHLPIEDDSCSAGHQVALSDRRSNYTYAIRNASRGNGNRFLDANKICGIVLEVCTKHDGHSLDNCFETIKNCSSHTLKKGSRNEICCPTQAKATYNSLRCNGSDPKTATTKLKEELGIEIKKHVSSYLDQLK